jgi:hypothetical protein
MNYTVRYYIEKALRESIANKRPDYPQSLVETVVAASLEGGRASVTKDVLYRAIELATMSEKG